MLNIFYVGVLPTTEMTRKEEHVKRLTETLTLGILVGFLLLATWPVQADTPGNATASRASCEPKCPGHSDRVDTMLDTLEEKGYDMSAIRAAFESGDTATAKTLLQQFLLENSGALPAKPARGDRPVRGVSQSGNNGNLAGDNAVYAGNTTPLEIRHGKGGIKLKSTQTT